MAQKNSIWLAGVIVFGALNVVACGGDEESGGTAGQGGGAGAAGAGATGGSAAGSGGSATVMPLPADTAGKACAGDSECAPGTCATMIAGLDGASIAAPGGYCMGGCMTDVDCGAGGTCVPGLEGGLCYESCTADTDCRQGYLCGPLTSTCRPAPMTDQLTDNQAGLACAGDAECGDGTCLTMRLNNQPFPGGYCSGACLMDSHCGAGGVCWRSGGAAGRCYDACAADADCTREGYRCRDITDTIKGCLPAADPLPDNTSGKACAADADCGGAMGSCAAMLPAVGGGEVAAPGGYCTIACEIDGDCGLEGRCVATRAGFFCFDPCATMTDCRDGYICGERGGMEMPVLSCTPIQPDGGVPDPDGGVVADAGL